jgi:hypothetical protein
LNEFMEIPDPEEMCSVIFQEHDYSYLKIEKAMAKEYKGHNLIGFNDNVLHSQVMVQPRLQIMVSFSIIHTCTLEMNSSIVARLYG